MLSFLTKGALLGLSSSAQPGPFQAYLVAQSVRHGARRGLPLAAVPLVSDPPVIAVVLAVLGQVPDTFVRWLGLAGGVIVVWLGVGAVRAALRFTLPGTGSPATTDSKPLGFLRATLVNLTNPNAWIFWSLVGGPTLTSAWRTTPLHAAAFLAGFYACLTAGNVLLVLLAGRAAVAGPKASRTLGLVSGLGLIAFGVWQLVQAARGP